MEDLRFFDANCQIGIPFNKRSLVFAESCCELLNELDRNGIEYALVRHASIPETGAAATNNLINELLAKDCSERLYGVWSILPDSTEETLTGDSLFHAMKKNKIRALTLHPSGHRFIADPVSIGKVMEEAAECKIPFIISPDIFGSWRELYCFVADFKDNIMICNPNHLWGSDRYFRPLLEKYATFHLDCAAYWIPEGVEILAKRYGAERILYGSGYPYYNHGSMMCAIKHANLSDAEKQLIAHGNIERIISEVKI